MSAALAYPVNDDTHRRAANDNAPIDQTLSYDARGLVTSIIDGAVSGNNRSYSYDGLGYLKTASGPWGTGSYKYDSLGNLRQKKLGSRTVNLTYDTRNRLTRSADSGASGTRTLAYDTRGNVTTLGRLGFVYDKSDQPVAVSGTANGIGAANGNYRYDGNLKRLKSVINGKTIYNVYDASGKLVHIDKVTEGKTTDYVFGPTGTLARITNNVVTYLHPDHLGSAQAGTSSTGGISWREQYTPFGEQLKNPAANDNLDGFTGHIKDKDTGLNYMQARYYDPVIGRFLSIDPVTFLDTGDPNFFNRYAYTFNDPVNLIDPDGMAPGDKFNTLDEAAKDFANHVDMLEKNDGRQKLERGADIRQDNKTNEFSYDGPETGTKDRVDIRVSTDETESKAVAIIHSHPKEKSSQTGGRSNNSRLDRKNEKLSSGDRREVKGLSKVLGRQITSIIRTPSGKLRKFDGSNKYKGSGVEIERD